MPAGFAARHLVRDGAPWAVVTGHRRESFGEGFERICRGLLALLEARPDLGLLYPVHLNPAVQEPVRRLLGGHPRIALIPPAEYLDFIWLMDRCAFVLTDSGGVQEEAPSLGKPVLVLREVTERPEGVRAGTSVLVGTDSARIVAESGRLIDDPAELAKAFDVLAEGGEVVMALHDAFWGGRFGLVIDKLGVPWMFHGPAK